MKINNVKTIFKTRIAVTMNNAKQLTNKIYVPKYFGYHMQPASFFKHQSILTILVYISENLITN